MARGQLLLDLKEVHLINNRQGNRRRGRGGQRNQNLGGRPDGNRQDNRQRGNAAQLLEKYKNMARDAQLAGDRVQTEYYLQFADHYFRVLSENRARFEDQRPRRDEEFDEDEGEEMEADSEGSSDEDQGEEGQRPERPENRDRQRGRRFAREDRVSEDRNPDQRKGEDREERGERRRGNGTLRVNGEATEGGLSLDVLPPAIGPVDTAGEEEEAARPRRRTRRPRAAGSEDEVAPAA